MANLTEVQKCICGGLDKVTEELETILLHHGTRYH
jgi:hypothetical protein